MSFTLPFSLRIVLFFHFSCPISLSHYEQILVCLSSFDLQFSGIITLFHFSTSPCFLEHKVVGEYKINMNVTFWAPVLAPQALPRLHCCPPSAWMYDVWFDLFNKDMDERIEQARGCN